MTRDIRRPGGAMRRCPTCPILAALIASVPMAPARSAPEPAPAPPESVAMTCAEVLARTDAHPLVSAASMRVTAAQAGIEVAGAAPNPSLEASAARGESRDAGPARVEWTLGLAVVVERRPS